MFWRGGRVVMRDPEAAPLDAAARTLGRGAGLPGPRGEAGGAAACPRCLDSWQRRLQHGGSAAGGAGQIWARPGLIWALGLRR